MIHQTKLRSIACLLGGAVSIGSAIQLRANKNVKNGTEIPPPTEAELLVDRELYESYTFAEVVQNYKEEYKVTDCQTISISKTETVTCAEDAEYAVFTEWDGRLQSMTVGIQGFVRTMHFDEDGKPSGCGAASNGEECSCQICSGYPRAGVDVCGCAGIGCGCEVFL